MTNHITEIAASSRPKIYRLPDEPKASTKLYATRTLVILCITALAVVVIPNMVAGKKTVSLPEIGAPVQPANASDELAASIRLGDTSSQIVGQMAKLPSDKEQRISVGSSNEIDHGTGKELLRIISQY